MDNDERASDQETLLLLNVIRMALDRREEVFQIIEQAADESMAKTRLAKLLDVEEHHCNAILHMQVSNWLGSWRDRLEEKAESLFLNLERDERQP